MFNLILKLKKTFSQTINLIRVELVFGIFFAQFYALLFASLSDIKYSILVVNIYSTVFFSFFLISFTSLIPVRKLRNISNLLFLAAALFIYYIAYDNAYQHEAFFLLILNYALVSFSLPNIKVFFFVTLLSFIIVIISYVALEFNTETPFLVGISALAFMSIAAFSIVFSRGVYRKRIKDRELFLNHLFNKSPNGLILVDKDDLTVLDVNEKSLSILSTSKEELVGKVIIQQTIEEQFPFLRIDKLEKDVTIIDNFGEVKYQKSEISYSYRHFILIQITHSKELEKQVS